jgi:hypothetical protein
MADGCAHVREGTAAGPPDPDTVGKILDLSMEFVRRGPAWHGRRHVRRAPAGNALPR